MLTPVIWHSVWQHGRVVHGAPSEAVWLDDDALRAWCRQNLSTYWAGWAARGAATSTRAGMALLTDWAVVWCVFGVLRLRYTIATGAITSKRGAGEWGLAQGGFGDAPLIAEALALRAAGGGVAVAEPTASASRPGERAAARRERVVAFMRGVIDGA